MSGWEAEKPLSGKNLKNSFKSYKNAINNMKWGWTCGNGSALISQTYKYNSGDVTNEHNSDRVLLQWLESSLYDR